MAKKPKYTAVQDKMDVWWVEDDVYRTKGRRGRLVALCTLQSDAEKIAAALNTMYREEHANTHKDTQVPKEPEGTS